MAEDLDDFFDDVEVAEAKVAEETEKEPPPKKQKTKPEDDLDDFFNEVEESVSKVQEEEVKEPPTKKVKTAPIRPRGMVVAASSSVVLNKKIDEDEEEAELNAALGIDTQPTVAAPPALPPPPTSSVQSSNVGTPGAPPPPPPPSNKQKKPVKRMAGGQVWEDPSLAEWPENDFRIFCGNLDATVTDTQLHDHFKNYPNLAMARVVKDASGNSKGFGFVSFLSPLSCAKAIREMDQTWLGSRPIRVKRSDWKDRNINQVKKKNKQRKKRGF
ncbi:unnamed protein product [Cylindrotheca closterium]|uniref:RRM domain-containing protein n=1 Tax=Cylindrotheca closterium TaxID=2856 RepID=A0AAD2FF59_9STRA|nr:unnamed protein product [Cylindrotheca closterium]